MRAYQGSHWRTLNVLPRIARFSALVTDGMFRWSRNPMYSSGVRLFKQRLTASLP